MQRTINQTSRKKIDANAFVFVLREETTGDVNFDVRVNAFQKNEFPSEAEVYVEAHANITRQRFSCGTVGNLDLPINEKLDELDNTSPILFAVKIVENDCGAGRLIGLGERFSPQTDERDGLSLLPLKVTDLGQLPWKVDFYSAQPVLLINRSIPHGIDRIKNDLVFQSLVLPSVLREILTYYCLLDVDENEHASRWIVLAELLYEAKPDVEHDEDHDETIDWINEVIVQFCSKHSITNRLVSVSERNEL